MSAADPKTYLWDRIGDLMGCANPSLDKVVERAKVSRGTAQRIREAKTSVGIDVLLTLADAFEMELYELLIPPSNDQAAEARLSKRAPALDAERALGTLAAHLATLDEERRVAITSKVHALLDAPDSKIALASAISAIKSPGEITHEAEDRKRKHPKAA